MAINEKISIALGDEKMFGIGVIDGVITSETYEKGVKSISISVVSPLKTPYSLKETDPKQELEFSRFKQDCRKRAFDMAHSELIQLMRDGKGDKYNLPETADRYYNWLISIPESK